MTGKYRHLIQYEYIQRIGWSKVICLDTEGAVNELAIIDGNEKELFNGLSAQQIKEGKETIQKILYNAYFIVGYSLNSDLRKLSDLGFKIAEGTVCLDVMPSIPRRIESICKEQYIPSTGGYSLCEVAEKVSVPFPTEGKWHQSKFDALVTLRLFKLIQKDYLYAIGVIPCIDTNRAIHLPVYVETTIGKPVQKELNSFKDSDGKISTDEVIHIMDEDWKNTELKDYGNGFCEALLYKEKVDDTILVRLSEFESASLYTIREINPDYSLASFYFDVIIPGRKMKIEKSLQDTQLEEATIPVFLDNTGSKENHNVVPVEKTSTD